MVIDGNAKIGIITNNNNRDSRKSINISPDATIQSIIRKSLKFIVNTKLILYKYVLVVHRTKKGAFVDCVDDVIIYSRVVICFFIAYNT